MSEEGIVMPSGRPTTPEEKEADAKALEKEIEMLDKVALVVFPLCLQTTLQKSGLVGSEQLMWNVPGAALQAYEAASVFLLARRSVHDQFPARRQQEIANAAAGKAAAARAAKGRAN